MKTIGIYTHDFSVFHDIVKFLKERNVAFFSLNSGKVPPWINVVITTKDSMKELTFTNVVIADKHSVKEAVEETVLFLARERRFCQLIVGIDPGEKPGVAVYSDGEMLLTTARVESPKDTAAIVKRVLDFYSYTDAVVRIGNGAPTFRNRIINTLKSRNN